MYLLNKEIEIRELSAIQVLECLKLVKELKQEILKEDFNKELTDIICENGVLAFMSVYTDNKKLFLNAKDALKKLKLSELVFIYDYYELNYLAKKGRE